VETGVVGSASAGVTVRRVGFRFGTDEELEAMHSVETEVQSERRAGDAPQPLESYKAFARSLPSQFDDHTWLAESSDGSPVGCAACWSNSAGDARVMECYVYVRERWRNRGIGSRLAREVVQEAEHDDRQMLVWTTYDGIPAGATFSRRAGGTTARVNRTSEVQLTSVDWGMAEAWIERSQERAAGYHVQFWEGPFPPALIDDAVVFDRIMQTAPRDELDVGDVVLEAEHVMELDRALFEAGRQRWTIFVRDPDGRCVGGTEVTFEPWQPAMAFQQNTAVHTAHRGLGLAKWAKAAMLMRIRDRRPDVDRVRTANAFSNDAMLAINDALGFEVVEVRTEWQGKIDELRRAMQ
jgi:GNAT superfamily N-acetyltransferase